MEQVWVKEYEKGISAEIDVKQFTSVVDLMNHSFSEFSDRPAFHNMGTTLTYKQVEVASRKFSSYLTQELGLKKGDSVALMMPNILQYPICLFGILQAGLIVVNVNPLYTARELEHQLKDSEAKAIVIFENSCSVLEKVLPRTNIEKVMTTQIGDFLKFPKNLIVNFVIKKIKKMVPSWRIPGSVSLKEIMGKVDYSSFKKMQVSLDDTAFLQYTGGTTGVSKGAELTHGNIVANICQAGAWLSNQTKRGEEIIITPLPLYHIFSLTANCFTYSSLGALNILITNPRDMPGFIKELKNWKFTTLTGVNTLFNGLLAQDNFKDVDFSSLRITLGGGMAVQRAVAEKWKEVTGCPLIEAYGLSETSPAACMNPLNLPEFNGMIGVPISNTLIELRNDDGKKVEVGEIGEICIKGPQVMKGYWKRPDETEAVMSADGFFLTGDLAIANERGYIKIVDRKKDMIIVSGFNVYPNEIEEIISQHAKVFEVAAVGLKDEKSGEVVKIFVVKGDESLTAEELKSYCKENMTGYKVPKHIEFRKDLPKSNVGKILRKELRE